MEKNNNDDGHDDGLERLISVVVRRENRKLLDEAKSLKSLLSLADVARTLSISRRTCETLLSAGKLPPPLWIGGVRRWHPDAIQAYLRSKERTP